MEGSSRQIDKVAHSESLLSFNPNSRLIVRGSNALRAYRALSIPVEDFYIVNLGLLVRSLDWDEDSYALGGSIDTGAPRRLNLYAFAMDGIFQKRIECRLVRFGSQGYKLIQQRQSGAVSVLDEHIHFYELLTVGPKGLVVRIDYVFSLDGNRIAAWTNDTFVDKYSEVGEPHVPVTSWSAPSWMVSDQLLARHDMKSWSNSYLYASPSARRHHIHVFSLSKILTRVERSWTYEAICGRRLSLVGLAPPPPDGGVLDTRLTSYPSRSGAFAEPFSLVHVGNHSVWFAGKYRHIPSDEFSWDLDVLRTKDGVWQLESFPLPDPSLIWSTVVHSGAHKGTRRRKKQGQKAFKQMYLLPEAAHPTVTVKQVFGSKHGPVIIVIGESSGDNGNDVICIYDLQDHRLELRRAVSDEDFTRRVATVIGKSSSMNPSLRLKHCAFRNGVLGTIASSGYNSQHLVLSDVQSLAMKVHPVKVLDVELSATLRAELEL